MPELMALIGILVFFAGLHLLWQAREEILAWLEAYLRALQAHMRHFAGWEQRPQVLLEVRPPQRNTLRIALGALLAFFLAPAMLTLGLVLRFLLR